jgi:hypothetical protein
VLDKTPSGELGCMCCLLGVGIGSEETVHASRTGALEGSVRFGVYELDRREDRSLSGGVLQTKSGMPLTRLEMPTPPPMISPSEPEVEPSVIPMSSSR